MPNIEIKAHYRDLAQGQKIAESLKARHEGQDHQIDTYFKTQKGRLKLRESSLYGALLIPYLRDDQAGPKKSDYALVKIENPAHIKHLLTSLLGVDTIVEKFRDIYLVDNVRVHLDEVKNLGSFFELEAVYSDETEATESQEVLKVRELLATFKVQEQDLIHGSYRELLAGRRY